MDEISVEVCYAKPGTVFLKALRVQAGMPLKAAVENSGVLEVAPEIELATCKVGIYGRLASLETVLRDRDRIEIYRPLIADPMEARRRRAMHKERK